MNSRAEGNISHKFPLKQYWSLGKPKVVLVMLVCALVGMLLAAEQFPSWLLLFNALLGIGLVSMGAAAFNHLLDQRIDQLMLRTQRRPLVQQSITPWQAALYASILSITGLLLLALEVNFLTAALTAIALMGYAVIYTAFLKRATPQNITIGGLAGAAPPLLGWTAVTDQVDANAILLVLIIFAWTPAHFWALAIYRCEDYRKAGVPMLPVTHGLRFTQLQVWLYCWLTVAATLMPYVVGMAGELFLFAILVLNARWVWLNYQVLNSTGARLIYVANRSFWFSIRYILYCFLLLLLDHYIGGYTAF